MILGSQWFGLLPDVAQIKSDSRRRLAESVAINAASHVRKQQWIDLRVAAQTIVDRDDDLISIGVRSNRGQLKVEAGHHDELWDRALTGSAGMDSISVPITLNRRPWGNVEFCFRAPDQTRFGALTEHPLLRLLAFYCIAGLFGYTFFVGKVMRVFTNTQVVPDRVRQALDTLAEGLLVLDEKANIVLANRAFADTVNVPCELLAESSANDLPWINEDDEATEFPWMTAIDESATVTEQILNLQVENGRRRIFSVNAAPIGGGDSRRGALATFRDVTHIEEHRAELETMLSMLRESRDEIERKNRELEILATQDALTGCLNRRAFFQRFGKLWSAAAIQEKPLSCIMIDNDHFKNVNDTYGHAVGDEVLRQVSRVLLELHGNRGLVCRYGGEEFCVLLPGMSFEMAIRVAEDTRIAIEQITFEEPAELKLTASIGVSETRHKAETPQDLINQADVCLYAAKRGGRNCVVPYDPKLDEMEIDNTGRDEPESPIPYQAVNAVLNSLAYRDPETAAHSRRVASLCTRVAPEVLDSKHHAIIEVAALLHDIGKVGVPDDVLLKPSKLSPSEMALMKQFERIGVDLVATAFDNKKLTAILEACRVPFGVEPTSEITTESLTSARLLAICDSYDSMVSDQVYRKGCSHELAIEELKRSSGTQFAPDLVRTFASIITSRPDPGDATTGTVAAMQIGLQVERLAGAIESQDADTLFALADRLSKFAQKSGRQAIAGAAGKIRDRASSDEISWVELLRESNELLEICRNAQSEVTGADTDASLAVTPRVE
ncbi:diguanylate cyclase [Rhodopirellula sp. MGV]|uniref:diguanylate cyclase n=1 Tax=Rhodopirellula sp. MGV TaxID=2023130 RepID=UPI000B96A5D5|nr:diguanylate cyclase [Rhodopirellula sp. MGV]PNY36013.1 HD domain-containing protein [Rhodopirellula baltica]